MINAFLVFCIATALLSHVGAWVFSPFRRLVRPSGERGFFAVRQADLQVDSVTRFQMFLAMKWLSIGFAIAILMYDFAQ